MLMFPQETTSKDDPVQVRASQLDKDKHWTRLKVPDTVWVSGAQGASIVETSPIFWQMSNNYNFSLFMLGDKGVSILNIEY